MRRNTEKSKRRGLAGMVGLVLGAAILIAGPGSEATRRLPHQGGAAG